MIYWCFMNEQIIPWRPGLLYMYVWEAPRVNFSSHICMDTTSNFHALTCKKYFQHYEISSDIFFPPFLCTHLKSFMLCPAFSFFCVSLLYIYLYIFLICICLMHSLSVSPVCLSISLPGFSHCNHLPYSCFLFSNTDNLLNPIICIISPSYSFSPFRFTTMLVAFPIVYLSSFFFLSLLISLFLLSLSLFHYNNLIRFSSLCSSIL